MTTTHVSHFGLSEVYRSSTSILFEGSLGACKRMAAAHGMEVDHYEGRTLSSSAWGSMATPDDFTSIIFRDGGLLMKDREGWTLVMPLKIWNNA
jgi:hypothetical protein